MKKAKKSQNKIEKKSQTSKKSNRMWQTSEKKSDKLVKKKWKKVAKCYKLIEKSNKKWQTYEKMGRK